MADEWEDRVDTVTRTMLGLTVACARCHDHKFDPITTRDYYALAGVFASTRMVNKTSRRGGAKRTARRRNRWIRRRCTSSRMGRSQNLNVFMRGNVERKGPAVPRRFLEVLVRQTNRSPSRMAAGAGELAEAIASRDNPLTARVLVNRVWGSFFGRPLVATPSNFGHSGALPTHPELLDDLAARFMENGWSIKALVREIVLSATYRQSFCATIAAKAARDPANELLWRMNRRRLTVEQWRDAVLACRRRALGSRRRAGRGSSMIRRITLRTVYARVSRLKLNDLLMQFDYPDANVHAEKRSVTMTPMQKLFVLNSAFMQRQRRARWPRGCWAVAEGGRGPREQCVSAAFLVASRTRSNARWRWSFSPSRAASQMIALGAVTRRCCSPPTKCFMWTDPISCCGSGSDDLL